jgi:pyruvate/2-oxoglutarate dehydrogenase complex dihydrolipoamide dehydrogenase (E3) component
MLRAGKSLGLLNRSGTIRRISKLYLPLGKHVVIYGGGLVGVELAEFLAERHRNVTLIEPGPAFGTELTIVRRWRIMHALRHLGATLLSSTQMLEIKRDRVVYRTKTGQVQTRRADTVIIALGAESNNSIVDSLRSVCATVHCIGDASELGYIEGAVRSGNRVAREI